MSVVSLTRPSPTLDRPARSVWDRLNRRQSLPERQCVTLALLLTPGSAPERRAWEAESAGIDRRDEVRTLVMQLPPAARLPALEVLLDALSGAPLADRQALLQAARRVMAADGRISAMDRLVWLVIRHRLEGRSTPRHGGLREDNDLALLPLALRQAIAQLTGYLARLVPAPAGHDADTPDALVSLAGAAWHDRVIGEVWGPAAASAPACHVPDVDSLGRALRSLGALGWMHRPVLARLWVEAARTRPGLITRPDEGLPEAAEALWLACALLDTPRPPALACHFIDTPRPTQDSGGT